MSTQLPESEWDGARFAREKRTGAVWILGWDQLVVAAVGVVAAVLMIVVGGVPFGFLLAVMTLGFTAGVAIPKPWGKSIPAWAVKILYRWLRSSRGQDIYRRTMTPVEDLTIDATPDQQDEAEGESTAGAGEESRWRDKYGRIRVDKGQRFVLPGELAELTAWELPGGPGFVWDPVRREGTVVAQVSTQKAFSLESGDAQETGTREYRETLSGLGSVEGVVRWQTSDQTTLISGARIEQWYRRKAEQAPRVTDEETGEQVPLSGETIDPVLHQSYIERIRQAESVPVHEMWVAVVISAKKMQRHIDANGGGLPGLLEAAMDVMGTVEQTVDSTGVSVTGWHTPRTLAGLSRSAFDPSSTLRVSRQNGEAGGADVSDAGPMAMDVYAGHLASDGAVHRTYMISEWPQNQADRGFLHPLIFAGGFRHTVTEVMVRGDIRRALNSTKRRKGDWEEADKMRRKLDQPESLEHEMELADIRSEEQQLVAGHGPIRPVGLVTVSAADMQQLEANCAQIISQASRANVQLRVVWQEQDAAFAGAALPFARVGVK